MNDDKKKKPGLDAEVLQISDDALEKMQTENIRLREQIANMKQELSTLQGNATNQVNAMQGEIKRMVEREGAHIAALRALSGHTENAALNQTRFDAIAKDFENFHNDVLTIGERLTQIEKQLGEFVAAQMRKEVL